MKMPALLVFVSILWISCEKNFTEDNPQNANHRDFEGVWSKYKQVYPFFEFKNINWDSIHSKYKPLAEQAMGDEIYPVIFNMLAELKDGHVALITEGGFPVRTYTPERMKKDLDAFSINVVRKYYTKEVSYAMDQTVEYTLLNDSIGYIYISTFRGEYTKWKSEFTQIFKSLKNAKSIIFDVRGNMGGEVNNYIFLIQCIATNNIEAVYYNYGIADTVTISPQNPYFASKQKVVLINGASSSAAEGFPAWMSMLDDVTLIGDTTSGLGGILGADYTMPSGKSVTVVAGYGVGLNGQIVEWNGVSPKIRVEQTEKDIKQNKDLQLEYAIHLLNKL
jgi:hypothetical protein